MDVPKPPNDKVYDDVKLLAVSPGLSEYHKYITCRAMDRLIRTDANKTFERAENDKIWSAATNR